jgi:AP-4 complex subunit epsilon-1
VKLIYFETLGYDTSFAHIIPINLCQSSNLYLKKMAYLLAALLVKPGDELCLLMNNTIIKDLQNENTFVIMTTLTLLRYFLTDYLVSHIIPILKKLIRHPTSIIRRKTYLALYNINQHFSHHLADIKAYAIEALSDQETPVIFAGLTMVYPMVMRNPHQNKDLTKRLVEVLWHILDHKYPKEYDYHRIPAPWAQIDLLKMLESLGRNDQQASSAMYEVLDKVIRYCTNISSSTLLGMKRCTSTRAFCSRR